MPLGNWDYGRHGTACLLRPLLERFDLFGKVGQQLLDGVEFIVEVGQAELWIFQGRLDRVELIVGVG